jgi:hypothetical protein
MFGLGYVATSDGVRGYSSINEFAESVAGRERDIFCRS